MLSAAPGVVQFVVDCDRDMSPCRIHQWSGISLHSGYIRKLKVLTELDRILLNSKTNSKFKQGSLGSEMSFFTEKGKYGVTSPDSVFSSMHRM